MKLELPYILVQLRQVDEELRRLGTHTEITVPALQAKVSAVDDRLGRILGQLEQYIHAELTRHS
jgi:hypothetical protein